MPKPTTFTSEAILESAFILFANEGLASLSVRKIAAELGASTGPIYSCFSGMDAIHEALFQLAMDKLLRMTEHEYTSNPFLNIGVGTLDFARTYPIVFRAIFLEDKRSKDIYNKFFAANRKQMRKSRELEVFTEEEVSSILEKLTIHTYGLASMICAGIIDCPDTEKLIDLLQTTGGDIIGATAFLAGKWDAFTIHAKEVYQSDSGCPCAQPSVENKNR